MKNHCELAVAEIKNWLARRNSISDEKLMINENRCVDYKEHKVVYYSSMESIMNGKRAKRLIGVPVIVINCEEGHVYMVPSAYEPKKRIDTGDIEQWKMESLKEIFEMF